MLTCRINRRQSSNLWVLWDVSRKESARESARKLQGLIFNESLFINMIGILYPFHVRSRKSKDRSRHAIHQIHSKETKRFYMKQTACRYFIIVLSEAHDPYTEAQIKATRHAEVRLVLEFIQKQRKHDIISHKAMNQSGNSQVFTEGFSLWSGQARKGEGKINCATKLYFSLEILSSNCDP